MGQFLIVLRLHQIYIKIKRVLVLKIIISTCNNNYGIFPHLLIVLL